VTSSAPIHRSVVDTVARFDGYIAAATPIIVVNRSITGWRSGKMAARVKIGGCERRKH
jgi:hypothetical protein